MGLEELDANKLIGPQQDVETIETWADRNSITYDTARFWAMRGAAHHNARQAPMVISATHRHLLRSIGYLARARPLLTAMLVATCSIPGITTRAKLQPNNARPTLRTAAATLWPAITQRIHDQAKGWRWLSTARVVQIVTGERWAPVLQHTLQPTLVDMRGEFIFG